MEPRLCLRPPEGGLVARQAVGPFVVGGKLRQGRLRRLLVQELGKRVPSRDAASQGSAALHGLSRGRERLGVSAVDRRQRQRDEVSRLGLARPTCPNSQGGQRFTGGVEGRARVDRDGGATQLLPLRLVPPAGQRQTRETCGDGDDVRAAPLGCQHAVDCRQQLLEVGQDAVRGFVGETSLGRPADAGASHGDPGVKPGAQPEERRDRERLLPVHSHIAEREQRRLHDLRLERADPHSPARMEVGPEGVDGRASGGQVGFQQARDDDRVGHRRARAERPDPLLGARAPFSPLRDGSPERGIKCGQLPRLPDARGRAPEPEPLDGVCERPPVVVGGRRQRFGARQPPALLGRRHGGLELVEPSAQVLEGGLLGKVRQDDARRRLELRRDRPREVDELSRIAIRQRRALAPDAGGPPEPISIPGDVLGDDGEGAAIPAESRIMGLRVALAGLSDQREELPALLVRTLSQLPGSLDPLVDPRLLPFRIGRAVDDGAHRVLELAHAGAAVPDEAHRERADLGGQLIEEDLQGAARVAGHEDPLAVRQEVGHEVGDRVRLARSGRPDDHDPVGNGQPPEHVELLGVVRLREVELVIVRHWHGHAVARIMAVRLGHEPGDEARHQRAGVELPVHLVVEGQQRARGPLPEDQGWRQGDEDAVPRHGRRVEHGVEHRVVAHGVGPRCERVGKRRSAPDLGAGADDRVVQFVSEFLGGDEARVEHLVLERGGHALGRGPDRDAAGLGLVVDLDPHREDVAADAAPLAAWHEREARPDHRLVPLAELVGLLLDPEQPLVEREERDARTVLGGPSAPCVEVVVEGLDDAVRELLPLLEVAQVGLCGGFAVVEQPAPQRGRGAGFRGDLRALE